MSDQDRRVALLTTYDKTGLVPFAKGLHEVGFTLLSTGGTAAALREADLPVVDVAAYTGSEEMLSGRVKTLHPRIHAGLLARRDRADDMRALEQAGIWPIELVCVNLYAFEAAKARGERDEAALRELIDIGGPTLLRAAAKSWPDVTVVSDPRAYDEVLAELRANERTSERLRRRLAARAFARTACYDAAIAAHLEAEAAAVDDEAASDGPPPLLVLALERTAPLRYGENPHQRAALYRSVGREASDVGAMRLLAGKEPSYNNLVDLDAALGLVRDLGGAAAAAVIKHATPCGAAVAPDPAAAFAAAYAGDPRAAFGGVVAVAPRVTRDAALAMTEEGCFLECVLAPAFDPDAVAVLTTRPRWGKSVRLVVCDTEPAPPQVQLRTIAGGVLVQSPDDAPLEAERFEARTKRAPTPEEERDLRVALSCVKHVRSNGIALAKGAALVGAGGGQTSRVGAVEVALRQAGARARGAALASDAFFPFPDAVEAAAIAGVTAIVQPGGSRRDAEVLEAADRAGLAMVLTGVRHFRH